MTFSCFWKLVLLSLLAASAAESNSSLQVTESTCTAFQMKYHVQTYSIKAKSANEGISEKNAADALGDMAFIFGSVGYPSPRGVKQYWNGVIEVNHVTHDGWGAYQKCNHAKGSTVYHCRKECPFYNPGCDVTKAGREINSHTNFHYWYSFPKAGKGMHWLYAAGPGCDRFRVEAKCVIKKLAAAAGCPTACSGPSSAAKCSACVVKMAKAKKKETWEKAVDQGGCPKLKAGGDDRRRRSDPRRRRSDPRRRRSHALSDVEDEESSRSDATILV